MELRFDVPFLVPEFFELVCTIKVGGRSNQSEPGLLVIKQVQHGKSGFWRDADETNFGTRQNQGGSWKGVPCRDRVWSARERAESSSGSGASTRWRVAAIRSSMDAACWTAAFSRGSRGAAPGGPASEAIRRRTDATHSSNDVVCFGERVRPLLIFVVVLLLPRANGGSSVCGFRGGGFFPVERERGGIGSGFGFGRRDPPAD
jgi:hypothetical protein